MRARFVVTLLCASVAVWFVGSAVAEESAGRAPGEPECSVPGHRVFPARAGIDPVLERAGKALVATEKPFHLAFLSLPGCKLEPLLDGGANWPADPVSVTPAGDVLYDKGSSKNLLIRRAGAEAQPLPPPQGMKSVWTPTLSDDGSSVVWFATKEGDDGTMDNRIFVRDLATGTERSIALDPKNTEYALIAANAATNEYVLCANRNQVLIVDGDGKAKADPVVLTSLERCAGGFRRIASGSATGWIAWDGVRLDGSAVRMQWNVAGGLGTHEFPRTNIESVSVVPDGTRIAVSAPAANRLTDKGLLVVLGLPDGKVIFQRELEPYSHPAVAFLDPTHLAVTASNHVEVLFIP